MLNPGDGEIVTVNRYLNIYLVDRAFGGPEEGGWWFDYGVVHASIPLEDGPRCSTYVKAWREWCDATNAERPGISSTSSEGQYVVRYEEEPGEDWPKERPHYE
jgi:hypothetical protein